MGDFFPNSLFGPRGGGGGISGAGAPGTLVYDSGAAGLTFGTGGPPADKTIQFTSQQDGAAYMVRVVHSGADTAFYEIISYTRGSESVTLPTPHNCSTDGDFVVGLDEPDPSAAATITITYRTLYADETEQSMTVELYDAVNATLLDTITATATFEDPFLGALTAEATLKNAYSAQGLTVGAITTGNAVMEDIVNALPDLLGIGATHSVVSAGPSALGSLAKSWQTTTRGTANYGISASDPGGSNVVGGLVIFRWTSASFLGASLANKVELMAGRGVNGAPNPGAAAQAQVNGTHCEEGQGGTSVGNTAGTGVAHDQDAEWYAYAWHNLTSPTRMRGHLTKLTSGFTWADKGFGDHGDGYWATAGWQGTTCRSQYASAGTVTGTLQIAHISQYTAGINEAKLQTIVESIVV